MARVRTFLAHHLYWRMAACWPGFLGQVRQALGTRQWRQWRSPELIRDRQLARLRRLIRHAVRHVPYYRRLHAAGSFPDWMEQLEDMADVPVLTKSTVVACPEDFLADNADRAALMPRRSGGSTGQVLHFYVSPRAAAQSVASEIWADGLAGYRPGDPILSLWGSHFDHSHAATVRQRLAHYLQNRETVISDHMDDDRLAEMCTRLAMFQPTVLLGYLSALVELAGYLRRTGRLPAHRPGGIISAAEPLTVPKRHLLTETFGCPVFNRYGARETGLIAMECDRHRGLHLDCESLWVDLVACPDDEQTCRVVATKLHEFAMPLIRYDLGDYTSTGLGRCDCGRGSPTIDAIRGRRISILRRRDGSGVAGEAFMALLDHQPLRSYRVVQQADYSVRIEVVADHGLDRAAKARILRQVRRLVGSGLPVRIEALASIPVPASGKSLPVVSRVPAPGRPKGAIP